MIFEKLLAIYGILLNFLPQNDAAVTAVISEKIYDCEEVSDDQRTPALDLSNFEFIPENDTHTFMNGSVKFLQGFAKLPGRIYNEKYIRGKWCVEIFDRKYDDLCKAFHSMLEPFYAISKTFPKCPIKAGTEWKMDMYPIAFDPKMLKSIPSSYAGLWRSTIIADFIVNGETKKDCRTFHADLFEA